MRVMQKRGLGKLWTIDTLPADQLVLCLLEVDDYQSLSYVTDMVGKPITFCPPWSIPRPAPVIVKPREGDDRLVVRSRSQAMLKCLASLDATGSIPPRSPLMSLTGRKRIIIGTPMYDRMAIIRPNLSVAQLLVRGVTRKDIRIATRRGWVELEPEHEQARTILP